MNLGYCIKWNSFVKWIGFGRSIRKINLIRINVSILIKLNSISQIKIEIKIFEISKSI